MRLIRTSAVFCSFCALSCGSASESEEPKVNVSSLSPEGGEVRLERIVGTDGSFPPAVFITGFFMKASNPDRFPMLGYDIVGGCYDTNKLAYWPTAQGENRQYVDVGNLTISDGVNPLVMVPQLNQKDELNREHEIFYGHEAVTGDTHAIADRVYSVNLSGSAQYPAVSWQNVLRMPGDFDVITPPVDAKYVELDPTRDYVIETSPPSDPNVRNYATFFQPETGGISFLCFDQVPATGRITVPASLIAGVPATGMLMRGHVSREIVAFDDGKGTNGRRIDLMALNCYVTPYVVQGADGTGSGP